MTINFRLGGNKPHFSDEALETHKCQLCVQEHKDKKDTIRTGTQVFYLDIRYSLEQCCSVNNRVAACLL